MGRATLLVLAAGMGSRYGGLKQIEGVGPSQETIIEYSIWDAIEGGFDKVVFVIAPAMRDLFEEVVTKRFKGSIEVLFVEQSIDQLPAPYKLSNHRVKPWGTGHALLCAKEKIDTPFAVINADDFYGRASFQILGDALKSLESGSEKFVMVGYSAQATLSESGVVSRGICSIGSSSLLKGVEEHHNISQGEDALIFGENSNGKRVTIAPDTIVSMNMWGFTPKIFEVAQELFIQFLKENHNHPTAEFYIPYIVNNIIEQRGGECRVLYTPERWFGVTYKEDSSRVKKSLLSLVEKGIYPTPLFKL
ncbi:MAG: sugar phosphate nucleotidyltransferase [Bacteroidales bacterium]